MIKKIKNMEQLDLILETCALVCDTTVEKIKGKERYRKTVVARQIFCYIARKYFSYGFVEIAKWINKDHSTIIHSTNLVDKMLSLNDPIISIPFSDILETLKQRMKVEIKVSIIVNDIIDPNIILHDIRDRYNCIITHIY
jgi:chromosomal replication initiation ATPase DnaA